MIDYVFFSDVISNKSNGFYPIFISKFFPKEKSLQKNKISFNIKIDKLDFCNDNYFLHNSKNYIIY